MTRTWKCLQCGCTEEIGYEWLAKNGNPVCSQCDCDMELQPEPGAADEETRRKEDVGRLYEKAFAADLQPEDLDESVHEMASSIASDINNGGLESQVRYLVENWDARATEKLIDELIADRTEGE